MKKRKIAAVLAVLLCFTAITPYSALYAEAAGKTSTAKEEVVYGNLAHDGSVEEVYVVNIFREEGKMITDYGDYAQVRNMTTDDEISVKNNCMTIETDKRPLYYEGQLENAELPWIADISYKLNGNPISADELAGKSGALEIHLDVKKNGNCDKAFFENYGLQISLSMDGNLCRDIETENATVANVGSDKQFTYMVMPGEGADIEIKAQVTDFEMAQISINGVKFDLDVDIDASAFSDKTQQLEDATEALDEGAGQIDAGAQALNEGSEELKDGSAELKANSSKLTEAVTALEANVSYTAYKAVFEENGLDIDFLKESNDKAIKTINDLKVLLKLYPDLEPMVNQLIQLLEANNAAIEGTEQYLTEVNNNLKELKDGVSEFEEGVSKLDDGAAALNDGTAKLAEGSSQLKDGTGTMKDEAATMDDKISDAIGKVKSEMLGQDMKDVSFVSSENTNVDAVQFVLKTEPIEVKAEASEAAAEPEKKGFFQKLLELFK